MNEPAAMQRALELAWRGWGRVHPNPMVGAVVLQGHEPVGEGWHAEFGGPHAEAAALDAAAGRAAGGTLVVTLEPCAHAGKQPPCVEAILRAGVRRVVIAASDPNPVAAGGAARLRAAGVDVEIGVLGDRAAAQNAAFLHALAEPARPFVALKLATSIDFRIADAAGQSRWVSGPDAREYVHWLRAGFDAIAVGLGTARADDPRLTVRAAPGAAPGVASSGSPDAGVRRGILPRVPPRRIVFDRALELPLDRNLVRTARDTPTTIVAEPGAPVARERALDALGVRVLRAANAAAALRALRADGIASLLVEGGGHLAGALLAADLVDRFVWIQSPIWLGAHGVAAVHGLPDASISHAERWRSVERRALGDDTLLVLDRKPCSPA
ncbi:MAG TPA: bifunctional diaminohydroxyphosphoribosylaminopyrimidine deaminase/5-amino-6-(5-phosphoribosylamino)uracil reductase RibD [Gemmatimonadales bacterium]|nr:bifunctional diaminohydroxyphosphoribosylaminopyrimidine deaminase/5-amino-6-(5-phosphoribosylamino)uracil reductase RibD [Gemmatimonadales bacterium]